VTLQQAEMRMVRRTCGIRLQDRVPSKGMIERLGLDDIIWYYNKRGCEIVMQWACAVKR